nr:NADH-quinone oxidoreductase subunit L [Bacteroidales bacterium]
MDLSISIWIPLIPFFVFIFLGLAGHKFKPAFAGIVGTTGLLISFILSLLVAYQYFFVEGLQNGVYQQIIAFNSTWLRMSDTLVVSMG